MAKNIRYNKGFTLAELLIALSVSSIILTAVATLAYALGRVNDSTGDTSRNQSRVRYTTSRLREQIGYARLICSTSANDFAFWRFDDNGDGQINIGELVYVDKGPDSDYLRLCEFPSSNNAVVPLSQIGPFSTNWWSAYSSDVDYVMVLPTCSTVRFDFDKSPPWSRFVSVAFEVAESGGVRQYQVNAGLRSWAGNLLNTAGDEIISDDDQ